MQESFLPYFDASLGRHAGTTVPTQGSFRPVQPITIRYRNFAGQDLTFVAELESVVRKGNHLVGRVAPTGRKIALFRDRIQNLGEVDSQLPQRVASGQPWRPLLVSGRCWVITRNTAPVRQCSTRFEPSTPTGE
ncbi:MAG: hypothetical protein WBD36_11155 [Bacteroidota bacterium]